MKKIPIIKIKEGNHKQLCSDLGGQQEPKMWQRADFALPRSVGQEPCAGSPLVVGAAFEPMCKVMLLLWLLQDTVTRER